MNQTRHTIFIKLGGSLITDKRQEATPRPDIIRRLAEEIREALEAPPNLRLVLGHGSGSFGHWEANRYGTRQGVRTADEWVGFANVGAAAARLNRLVVDTFRDVGVPVLSLQPSASALADEGHIINLNTSHIERALDHNLVPLIFGDVAFDQTWGGTILSTEDLFVHLASILPPTRILLLGNAPGVFDNWHRVIETITPATYPKIDAFLRGACCTDVTGGMADKVKRMVHLVQNQPNLHVRIFSGQAPGNLKRALLEPDCTLGTLIKNE